MSTFLLPGLLILTLCLLGYLIHKVRRIHVMSYELLAIKREVFSLYDQLSSLYALDRKLGLSKVLPPMRGWAGSPDFLLQVAETASERHPSCVMECSSGVSTVVLARCLQINGHGHVYSLEHDARYAEKTRQLLKEYGLEQWATVLDAPLEASDNMAPWYRGAAIPEDMAAIDMLVIDGPPSTTAPLARYPALPHLWPRLADNCTILLDDAARPDETEMVKRWCTAWPELSKTQLNAEKGLVRLDRRAAS